ncbi:MAG: HupE/UreJ family protein [Thermoanaerobaculia bacterium]
MGKVQVYASFLKDGTYRIDLNLDSEHLAPGDFGGPAGKTRLGPIAGLTPKVDSDYGKLLRHFVDGATISFDGRPVEPEVVEIVPPDNDTPPGRTTMRLRGPIPGGAHTFTWRETMELGSYPLVLQNEGDESAEWGWLSGGAASPPFALSKAVVPPARWAVAKRYLRLGFTHFVPEGPDPILFVLGLFLLSRRLKAVLGQVIVFTVAHTLTLILASYGVISLRPSFVAPLIALSIVFVAVGNILVPELKPWRLVAVFAFGLLHGLGFAGVLTQLGLPQADRLTALLSFNLGVEGGQLAVLAGAFLLVGLPFRDQAWYRQRVIVPASCLIAAVGLYWSMERMLF